jgi:hypothetical protein
MYRWMTYIPLAIATPWLLNLKSRMNQSYPPRKMVFSILGVALLLGLPVRTLLAFPEWSKRSIGPIENATASIVHSNDVVVCSLKAWFAIRSHAQLVYCCDLPARGVLSFTVNLPTNDVSLLCLFPQDYTNVVSALGGHWRKIPEAEIPNGEALAKTRYAVDFYRRSSDPTTSTLQ